jgi:hypothetical protein
VLPFPPVVPIWPHTSMMTSHPVEAGMTTVWPGDAWITGVTAAAGAAAAARVSQTNAVGASRRMVRL